ncbi:MAG TPA: alpha/beta hydrolase [Steroidobacteraceae bacterium]|jgi:hypothetical protein|nr:alpha/beta hydrolase [Steroidobacteraceae bacterium]
MKIQLIWLKLGMSALLLAPAVSIAGILSPGLYRNAAGYPVYVGIENSQPDPPVNQYFEPRTQRTGELPGAAHLIFQRGIEEQRQVIDTPAGRLGVSLYHVGSGRHAALILIHGNDPESREMGFIIPYFVLNGISVISFDQRGIADSAGNWQQNGPEQRAVDVNALVDAFAANPLVDPKKLGLWAFSNGGWTAPIVATKRTIAFMILKSAAAESIESNLFYTVEQRMRRKHFDSAAISSAIETWRSLIGALAGKNSWDAAREMHAAARAKPWFKISLIPLLFPSDSPLPPPAQVAEGMRRFALYDPSATLSKVRTPTLALFGALDRNVDAADSARRFKIAFANAGMTDFTVRTFQHAGHTFTVSKTGFNDEPGDPERLPAGYPDIMLQWLRSRGLLEPGQVANAPR